MKSAKFSFVVLATVLGSSAALMGACGDSGSSGGGDKNTGGTSSGGKSNGNAGEGGTPSSTAGQGGGGSVDKCAGVKCSKDDNPCTEDVCNPATGKCGIPRSGTSCNDGKYCNGKDTCDNGECTEHAGSPCAAGQACVEDMDTCECDGNEDCPEDEFGEWSDPPYASDCAESKNISRTLTTYACVSGQCKATVSVESDTATRDTDGDPCPSDGVYCNGVEWCVGGNCVSNPSTVPCPDTNYACTEGSKADTGSCAECYDQEDNDGSGGNPGIDDAGNDCGSGEQCCYGNCTADTCFVIVTSIKPTLTGVPITSNPLAGAIQLP